MNHLTAILSRRRWLAIAGTGLSCGLGGTWLGQMAAASPISSPRRQCLLLWMNGGPSQTDTFDMKPGHAHGGPFQAVATRAPGIEISEHLPRLTQWTNWMAVIRSMSTREGDHGRATDHLRTGYLPQGAIQFPVLGSLVAHECEGPLDDLPRYVSILPRGLFRPGKPAAGFLGAACEPLMVGGGSEDTGTLRVDNLSLPAGITGDRFARRQRLLEGLQQEFLESRPGKASDSWRTAAERSVRLMSPSAAAAFNLEDEPASVRERYGAAPFGQGCLLARRLLERDVPFVEVTLGGWDTHVDNFTAVQNLSGMLDSAWSALLEDLQSRGRLDSTLIVWMGEFGRTPVINPQAGRDHYPKAWTAVLAGGGIRGGQVVGRTSADGLQVEDRPVSTPDLMNTICRAIGLDPRKQNVSNVARPIRLADPEGEALEEILTEPAAPPA